MDDEMLEIDEKVARELCKFKEDKCDILWIKTGKCEFYETPIGFVVKCCGIN